MVENPNEGARPLVGGPRVEMPGPAVVRGEREELATSPIDVRPILPRIPDGLFQRAEAERDRIFATAVAALEKRGLRGNVLRSTPLSGTPWVSIELWSPMGGDALLTRRSSAKIQIGLKPYFAYDLDYAVEIDFAGDKRTSRVLSSFDDTAVERTIAFLVGDSPRPKFRDLQLRKWPWELWKPRNKPDALSTDWLGLSPALLVLLGFATMAVGVGPLFVVAGIIAAFALRRRKLVVRTSGKPQGEPRTLIALDSWQTIVFGLGSHADELRRRLTARLDKPMDADMRWAPERVWYWGLDGVIEREQIVVNLGRAILFAHVHRYQDDLYVGWDAHLNRGQWVEKELFRGIDKRSGRLAEVRVAVRGTQPVSEYDVNDGNSLVEWGHSQLTRVVQELMAEHKISQEVDFSIIRGERHDLTSREGRALGDGGPDKSKDTLLGRTRAMLRRTG